MALLTEPLLHQQGQVARAGADVQYITRLGTAGGFFSREVLAERRSKGLVAADAACAGRRRREVFDCCVLPAVVQSEAQQRVVEVVEPGDRGEHLLNGLFLGLPRPIGNRSEEHTSELQSRLHLVCRLLLEKKNRTRSRGSSPPRSPKPIRW